VEGLERYAQERGRTLLEVAIALFVMVINSAVIPPLVLFLILFIVGILTVVVSLVMNMQRSRTTHIEEHRYDK